MVSRRNLPPFQRIVTDNHRRRVGNPAMTSGKGRTELRFLRYRPIPTASPLKKEVLEIEKAQSELRYDYYHSINYLFFFLLIHSLF